MNTRLLRRSLTAVLLCILLLLPAASLAEAPEIGDLIHFIPTVITVEEDSVSVEGYFINLNEDKVVSNFTNVEMAIYTEGEQLINGSFGAINEFSVQPLGAVYQIFNFNMDHDLKPGGYVCSDSEYAIVTCSFSYRDA